MSIAYATPGPTALAGRQESATVLLVDDNRSYREMVALKLELEGHIVTPAADGAAALEIARREQPAIIFLDLVLPGLDGLEVLSRLKAEPTTAGIPVVIVSARSERRIVESCRGLGAVDYLHKSRSVPATFCSAVERFASFPSRRA